MKIYLSWFVLLFFIFLSPVTCQASTLPVKNPEGQYWIIKDKNSMVKVTNEIITYNITNNADSANIFIEYSLYNEGMKSENISFAFFAPDNIQAKENFHVFLNGSEVSILYEQSKIIDNVYFDGLNQAVKQISGVVLEAKSNNDLRIVYNQRAGQLTPQYSDYFFAENLFFIYIAPLKLQSSENNSIFVNIPSTCKLVDLPGDFSFLGESKGEKHYKINIDKISEDFKWIKVHYEPWFFFGISKKTDVRILIYVFSVLVGIFSGLIYSKGKNKAVYRSLALLIMFLFIILSLTICPFKNIFLYFNDLLNFTIYTIANVVLVISFFFLTKFWISHKAKCQRALI